MDKLRAALLGYTFASTAVPIYGLTVLVPIYGEQVGTGIVGLAALTSAFGRPSNQQRSRWDDCHRHLTAGMCSKAPPPPRGSFSVFMSGTASSPSRTLQRRRRFSQMPFFQLMARAS
jgi:hypothetical protein